MAEDATNVVLVWVKGWGHQDRKKEWVPLMAQSGADSPGGL